MFSETSSQALTRRYGSANDDGPEELAPFLRHRSVRTYSPQPVPEELVSRLIACAQSASTSSNLQLWSVVSIQDPDRRAAIKELCANQDQVKNAPWFLAFVADHGRMRACADAHGESSEALESAEFYTMAVVDAALAAERLVCAAEFLGLGICYIGALRDHPAKIASLLELPEGVFGLFGLCLGYPAEDTTAAIKPRLDQNLVWFRERYDATANVQPFDDRMRGFYEEQGMKGDFTWSARSARRIQWKALGTRIGQLEFLQSWKMLRK